MLNDEEKKAIEILKLRLENASLYVRGNNEVFYNALGIVLKLIEKQSKEIEELKKKIEPQSDCAEAVERTEEMVNMRWVNHNYILKSASEQKEKEAYIKGTNIADELCNKKWEDKIKAKIEEKDKEIKVKREIARNPMDRVSGRLLTDSIVELEKTKKVLQSLLEKE